MRHNYTTASYNDGRLHNLYDPVRGYCDWLDVVSKVEFCVFEGTANSQSESFDSGNAE